MNKLNAFIVAAGLGERLRPITDHIPKPLVPILGRPAIELILDRVLQLSPEKIGINIYHKSNQMKAWASGSTLSSLITLFPEDPILGTGGALKNAYRLLSQSTFIVHNADIITDLNLSQLSDFHRSTGNLATLAVHDCPPFNNVWIDSKGQLKAVGTDNLQCLKAVAFTGIAVYEPDFLDLLPDGESSVVDAWLLAKSKSYAVGTVDFSGCFWQDIGTPSSYAGILQKALLDSGEQLYISPEAECRNLSFQDWAVIEGNVSAGDIKISRSLLLPGATIHKSSEVADLIAGPGFEINIKNRSTGKSPDPSIHLVIKAFLGSDPEFSSVGLGGSDRNYFRVRSANKSGILLVSPPEDKDFERQLSLTKYLKAMKLAVPELLLEDSARKTALFEDLGDNSLYTWLKCRRDIKEVEKVYCRVLDILISLHTLDIAQAETPAALTERSFDHQHLRWETDYFLRQFILGFNGIKPQRITQLNEDFERLAVKVASFRKTVLHRDFQCQNVMIKKGDIPVMIDYQGIRTGPPAYDLASILWDPYNELKYETRDHLIQYYISNAGMDGDELAKTLLYCRLQRHMQALGAYSFLSMHKGKKYFLKHVPIALKYLREETHETADEYPALYALMKKINA